MQASADLLLTIPKHAFATGELKRGRRGFNLPE
jgi:hypothetical protein